MCRVLLPPNSTPVQSSRLIRTRPTPIRSAKRGASSSGVGRWARLRRGSPARTRRTSSGDRTGTLMRPSRWRWCFAAQSLCPPWGRGEEGDGPRPTTSTSHRPTKSRGFRHRQPRRACRHGLPTDHGRQIPAGQLCREPRRGGQLRQRGRVHDIEGGRSAQRTMMRKLAIRWPRAAPR